MHQDKLRAWRGLVLAIAGLTLSWPAAAAAEPAAKDPVEALRQALRQDRDAPGIPEALKSRETHLTECADRVRALDDLGRSLMLHEWRCENLDPTVSAVDQKVWLHLRQRFGKQAEEALKSSDLEQARAAVTMVAEMATLARTTGFPTGGTEEALADFTPALVELTRSSDPALRTAAVRALGTLGLYATKALAALERTLKEDGVPQRRAAAGALVNLIRLAAASEREGSGSYQGAGGLVPPTGGVSSVVPPAGGDALEQPPMPPSGGKTPMPLPPAGRTYVGLQPHDLPLIDMSKQVVPVAGLALGDTDAKVRRLGAEAIQQAALNLTDSILLPASLDFPPPGRPLTQDERDRITDYRREVEGERKLLEPLARALNDQVPAVGKAVNDTDLRVSSTAGEVLEALAAARRKLARRAATVPAQPGEGGARPAPTDPLGEALKGVVPVLAGRLSTAQEPRSRLVPLYALEALEADAAPAAPEVVKALEDKDAFVRWAAVRALGRMDLKGEVAEKAVTGLAPLLKDDSADVRTSTAVALQYYGPAARGAAAALAAVVKGDDPELRLLAITALEAAGPGAGKEAAPALVAALKAVESEVRAAAARALGHVGPLNENARTALRKALDDPDGEVRRAAAATLLRAGQQEDKPDKRARPKRPDTSP